MSFYGVTGFAAPLAWPTKGPDAVLDYAYDFAPDMAENPGDTIVAASIAVQPSGVGEITINSIVIAGTILTVWLSGGVSGRRYLFKLIATTDSTPQPRRLEVDIMLLIDPLLATPPLSAPPSNGFSAPVTWPS